MASPYNGGIVMLSPPQHYTDGMEVPVGYFGVVGNASKGHRHPSGLPGIDSPKGTTGWRNTNKLSTAGPAVSTPIQDFDYDAWVTAEGIRYVRKNFYNDYGDNRVFVQVARDDALASFPDVTTFQQLKDYVVDNCISRVRGAVPLCGVTYLPHLNGGRGGYRALFSGTRDGQRVSEYLGCFAKTPEGMEAAGRAWDEAARAAGYRKARLNFQD